MSINPSTGMNSNMVSETIPALGELWSHAITNRIMLEMSSNMTETSHVTEVLPISSLFMISSIVILLVLL
jgi:hypothetical protein